MLNKRMYIVLILCAVLLFTAATVVPASAGYNQPLGGPTSAPKGGPTSAPLGGPTSVAASSPFSITPVPGGLQ